MYAAVLAFNLASSCMSVATSTTWGAINDNNNIQMKRHIYKFQAVNNRKNCAASKNYNHNHRWQSPANAKAVVEQLFNHLAQLLRTLFGGNMELGLRIQTREFLRQLSGSTYRNWYGVYAFGDIISLVGLLSILNNSFWNWVHSRYGRLFGLQRHVM